MGVYENLSEEECYLYSILQDESGLDLAEFSYLDETQDDNVFRAWPVQWFWWRCDDQKQIDRGSRCLAEGTLVLTKRGHIPIEQVKIGDEVLTHMNRWKPVVNVFDQGVKPTMRVMGQGHPDGLVVTEHHKFWARHARRCSKPRDGHKRIKVDQPQWIKAKNFRLRDGSQVLSTRWSSPAAQAPSFEFTSELEPSYRSGQQNLVSSVLTEDFMWLFGLFLAEGSTYIDSQYAKTSWSIHSDEVSEVVQYLDRLNLNYNIYYRKTDRSATICVNSRPITEWLSSQIVGSGNARTKQMPSWALALDEGLRRSCFNGMVFGDGYVRPNGRIEYSTSSRALAFGIKLLGQSLGLASSVSRQEPLDFVAINGRQIFPGDSYTVSFDRSNTVKFEDGKSWVGISNIEPEGDVRVYDLEVEEDHSYIAEGIVVHNSVGKSLSIKFRAFAFPFVCPGEEMVITAPEGIHLDAVTDNIESLYINNRLAREMIAKGRGGIKHRPFMMNFINGGRIIGRIPQRDGKGLKGTHPIWLEQDEACFPGDTLIYTKLGYKKIKDISIGDEVLTHKNRWKKVVNTYNHGFKDVVQITGQGHQHLVTTPNHRFWAKKVLKWKNSKNRWGVKEFDKFDWIRAGDLQDSFWSSPISIPSVQIPECIPKSKTGNSYSINIFTEEFLWAMGLFVAEGSTSSSYGADGKINKSTWSIHIKEADHVVQILKSAGLNPFIQPCSNSANSVNVVVSHVGLAPFLAEEIGSGCYNKRIPVWIFSLSEAQRQAFLDGLVYGDGCESSGNYEPGRWRLSTTSKALAYDTKILAHSLGYFTSVFFNEGGQQGSIRGRTFISGPSWEVIGAVKGQGFIDENYRLTKVKSVIKLTEKQCVYDIEVEDDHSFLAEGIFVHNSDFPEQAWAEIIETVKIQNPMARWRAHGVTRGVGGGFDERCQPDSGWKVHALPAMFRPNWTDGERQQKIQEYGGHVDSVDYRRNILGLPGDQNSPIFVLYRLMAATDVDTGSEYNNYEYTSLEIDESAVRDYGSIIPLLDLPANHRSYKKFWIGMDLGWTIAPSSIVIFAEDNKTRKGKNCLKLLARILLKKVAASDQSDAILHLLDIYRPMAFALDSTGAGLPLFDYVQKATREDPNLKSLTSRIKGYNFSEKIIAEFDDSIQIDDLSPDGYKEGAIYRNVLEWSTDILRGMVDEQTIILPYDKSIISEFQGQTWSYSKAAMDSYGRKRIFSNGSFHTLDACRMAALAFQQQVINDFIEGHKQAWEPPPMLFL